ncbi:MAG: TAXI family TRAP transporter solute-binding subunit [Hyphomicrobiales bacterium]
MATRTKKLRGLLALLGMVVVLIWPGNAVRAQQAEQLRTDANAGTVRVLAAGVDTAHMLHELATTLNKTGSLRILPVMGGGGIQNVIDTLYLQGIDMALVRYDMLDLLRAQKTYGKIEARIRYVTKLFDEEIHLGARKEITSIEQLAGLRVNYGDPGSGTFERADRIFRAIGVSAIPVSYATSQALEKVRSGEIAATVHVGPRPSPFVRQFEADDGVHLLSIPLISGLEALYKRATLEHKDYPDLISEGQTVGTLSVETVLAVYNWAKPNDRSRKVDIFVTTFFDRLAEVQQPDRHPKWREVALLTEVPGWRRLKIAQQWVTTRVAKQKVQSEQATASVSKPLKRQFEAFLSYLRQSKVREQQRQAQPEPAAADAKPTSGANQQLEELFTDFLRWREQQTQ